MLIRFGRPFQGQPPRPYVTYGLLLILLLREKAGGGLTSQLNRWDHKHVKLGRQAGQHKPAAHAKIRTYPRG